MKKKKEKELYPYKGMYMHSQTKKGNDMLVELPLSSIDDEPSECEMACDVYGVWCVVCDM